VDREGLSKIRRAEMLARLTALEKLIVEQEERVLHIGLAGWDVSIAAERLRLLNESHALYRSALKHLLGDDFGPDTEAPPDGDEPAAGN
jgi:hypothetical protein